MAKIGVHWQVFSLHAACWTFLVMVRYRNIISDSDWARNSSMWLFQNRFCFKFFEQRHWVCLRFTLSLSLSDQSLHNKVYVEFAHLFSHGLPEVWAKFTCLFRKCRLYLQSLCMAPVCWITRFTEWFSKRLRISKMLRFAFVAEVYTWFARMM